MTFWASRCIMKMMTINHLKNSLPNTLWPPLAQLWSFFQRLQWRLTLAYALFTAITALVFGIIGVALWWYLTFWVWLPNGVANDLLRTSSLVSHYLEHTPPDQVGLNNWLDETVAGNRPAIRVPPADKKDSPPPLPPPRLDRVVSVAIVDAAGQLLISYPAETFVMEEPLSGQIPPEAITGFQAALQGETDPAALATRNAAGNIVATAPIFGSNQQLLGAIFVETVPPLQESEFLQLTLRQMILPVVWGVLIVGGVAGVLFGYFIARDLTRRLYALAGAADAWSHGDFDVLVSDNSGDELGQLAQRLNQMALQLQTLLQTRQELASLDERNRLARDLHDAVKQQVFATAMQVGAALTFFDQNPSAAKTCLTEADRLVHQTQQELTSLIQELRPAALEDKGLTTALREYINDWSRQNNIAAELRVRGEQSLPLLLEQTLFRVTQEALANIARHSDATTVEVYLAWEGDQVTLILSDNGRGFNPVATGKGLGLRSMRERVEAIGGNLSVTSQPEGGTQVMVRCDKLPKT
jgi:NarL family two-component system sensor histidine kinase LiaS